MNKETQEKFKKLLQEEREKIKKELEVLKKDLDFGDDVDSLDEESDESEEFANYIGVALFLKKRLNNIDVALEKLKIGTYGKCERCGNSIIQNLLEAYPESKLCKDCKKEQD